MTQKFLVVMEEVHRIIITVYTQCHSHTRIHLILGLSHFSFNSALST